MQVLTALELARQARIAANRAFLAGLQLTPQAVANGQVTQLCAEIATETPKTMLAKPDNSLFECVKHDSWDLAAHGFVP